MPNGRPDRLHPTTTCEAIGSALLSLGSPWSLLGARWDTRVAETTHERPALAGAQPVKYPFANASAKYMPGST
eukprot:8641237-Pyramimonas_sp.AAC.1